MQLRTEVEPPRYPFSVGFDTPMLLVGSCFTENIGAILRNGKLPVLVNPLGIAYNPLSIRNGLDAILAGRQYLPGDIRFDRGLWYSYDFHSRFSHPQRDECLALMNSAVANAHSFLGKLRRLVVTFGTARVYSLKRGGCVVANCHKTPAGEFEHRTVGVEEIVVAWGELIGRLLERNADLKIIFTVSPIRHWKDGAVENQLSKATLTVAIHRLIGQFPGSAYYFPGYEIVMDDLRDYRFYADDMLHPSSRAIEYIWGKFESALLDADSRRLLNKIQRVRLAASHRPFNPHTPEHQQFVAQTVAEIEELRRQHPHISFDEELKLLNSPVG